MDNEANAITQAAIEEARSSTEKETFENVDDLMKELMK